jgi:hypothetical protein
VPGRKNSVDLAEFYECACPGRFCSLNIAVSFEPQKTNTVVANGLRIRAINRNFLICNQCSSPNYRSFCYRRWRSAWTILEAIHNTGDGGTSSTAKLKIGDDNLGELVIRGKESNFMLPDRPPDPTTIWGQLKSEPMLDISVFRARNKRGPTKTHPPKEERETEVAYSR